MRHVSPSRLAVILLCLSPAFAGPQQRQVKQELRGLPASDALGPNDVWGNPSFVGGVANGGSTAHSVW